MNMDRNSVIGFILLAVLLFVYLFVSTKESQQLQMQQQREKDSLVRVQRLRDSISLSKDTAARALAQGAKDTSSTGFRLKSSEEWTTMENDLIKVYFTNKGGQPHKVELKKYASFRDSTVILGGTDFDKFGYMVRVDGNNALPVSDLYFTGSDVQKMPDGSQQISYTAVGGSGEKITHTFTLRNGQYLMDWVARFSGVTQLFKEGGFHLTWQSRPLQQESDAIYERQMTNICFLEDNSFDYIQSKSEKTFEKPVKWVSVSQQFFNTTLIAASPFTSGDLKMVKAADTSRAIADVTTVLHATLPQGNEAAVSMQLFYGPNDYDILRKLPVEDMDKIINLGRDMYAFVRPINKYIIMPVFDFFKDFILSFGLVIALLTIFIRLATSPLVYTSYLSGAKMKALRPEIDLLKQKFGNDQQQIGIEQMKLFREAGVNPLGGCIPALLQIPIFFALYSFFNSNIALRGQSFLWAENLASYDAIIHFPINIWGLGNHLSLFTLTAAGTSFLISLYSTSMTPDSGNPALKYMPYIFPFILIFIFNRLPSALTWYYTVSNVITIILQWIIQNYIIDHDKILAKIEANRKKPKTKSKWQEKFDQMQESQRKLQDMKNKGGKK